jgi:hypothetical protein
MPKYAKKINHFMWKITKSEPYLICDYLSPSTNQVATRAYLVLFLGSNSFMFHS